MMMPFHEFGRWFRLTVVGGARSVLIDTPDGFDAVPADDPPAKASGIPVVWSEG